MFNSVEYYVCGSFQPLTKEAIKAVRDLFIHGRARRVRVYVVCVERGPEAPFSFVEIKTMWERVFDMGGVTVLHDVGEYIGQRVDVPGMEKLEKDLRDSLSRSCMAYDYFGWYAPQLAWKVAKTLAGSNGQWKQHLHGPRPRMLPQPSGS